MGGKGLYVNSEGSNASAVTHRADAEVINFMSKILI